MPKTFVLVLVLMFFVGFTKSEKLASSSSFSPKHEAFPSELSPGVQLDSSPSGEQPPLDTSKDRRSSGENCL